MYKIFTVLGTRPEIIKLSRIIKIFDKNFDHKIIHTGQNYDYELYQIFFNELKIRKPDLFLNCAKSTAVETIAEILLKFKKYLDKNKPDAIFVLGDTNSAYASLVAKKNNIPVFHFEAGNRCFDDKVPEEINRKIVDHISDLNMTYTKLSKDNLIMEGLHPEKVIEIGSPMKEVLNYYKNKINNSKILKSLKLTKKRFFLISLHREENVDDKKKLTHFLESINSLCKLYKIPGIISTHYRTAKNIEKMNIKKKYLRFNKPFGFFDYIKLQKNSFITLSDSGTLSEESSLLGKTAVHLRHCTERPEGLENGAIILSGPNLKKLKNSVKIASKNKFVVNHPSYNKDNVSGVVLKSIISYLDYYR